LVITIAMIVNIQKTLRYFRYSFPLP